jgi:hypothetical protein
VKAMGSDGKKRGVHFLFPMQEMGANIQNGGPQLLVLHWRAGGIHVVKDNGFRWLRWLIGRCYLPK